MINQEYLHKLSTWATFLGIVNIIFGALSALGGLFAFLIGSIPGIITIILGIKLLGAKNAARELIQITDEQQYAAQANLLISELTTYFTIQGILMIVGLVMGVIFMIFGGITLFSSLSSLNMYH